MSSMIMILLNAWILFIPFVCCQPAKTPAEWSLTLADRYPNPMTDHVQCKTSKSSRMCDVNAMLPSSDRDYLMNALEKLEGNSSASDECLCNKNCSPPLVIVTVAIMKKLGPNIIDFRAEAKDLAAKFRELWSLGNCSVVFVGSWNDDMSYSEAGPDVLKLLSKNKTEGFDWLVHTEYFSKQRYTEGINETMNLYSGALHKVQTETQNTDSQNPLPESEEVKNDTIFIIVIVIIVIIVIIIGSAVVIIIVKLRRKKHISSNELQSLNLKASESEKA